MLLMNIPTRLAVALAGLTLLAFNSPAQERRPGGQEGRGRDGGGLRANPLFAALDTNRDNIIHWIDRFQVELSRFREMIATGESKAVLETFEKVHQVVRRDDLWAIRGDDAG